MQSVQSSRHKAADAKVVDRCPVQNDAVLEEASCCLLFQDFKMRHAAYSGLQPSACVLDEASHCEYTDTQHPVSLSLLHPHPVSPYAVQNNSPVALLQVAKVGVHSSHLLDIQCIPSKWVRAECHKSGLDIDRPFRVIRLLMRHLQSLPDGQYMLAHQAGASAVTCFRAAPDGLLDGQVGVLQASGSLHTHCPANASAYMH